MGGTFVISLDFELLWGLSGRTERQTEEYLPHIEGAQNALSLICGVLARYGIKSTVAFVGGMNFSGMEEFLDAAPACRPAYSEPSLLSYESSVKFARSHDAGHLLFCPEAVARLAENPLVEPATHTFSHYYCLKEGQTPEQFEADIKTAVGEARKSGMEIKTIIFPRNQVSDECLDICARYGITHYRGYPDNCYYHAGATGFAMWFYKAMRILDTYIPLSGHNGTAVGHRRGLTNVQSSRFLRPYSARLALLEPLKLRRVLCSIEAAARNDKIYHLWWHPHNFGCDTEKNLNQLEKICQCFDRCRDKYGMQSKFIKEL